MVLNSILDELACARRIADYANELGVSHCPTTLRVASDHMGAVLADAVLQAGLSYRSVVHMRVKRIYALFPETSTLAGLRRVLEADGVADFLLWNHHVKASRFVALVELLTAQNLNTTEQLRVWLSNKESRTNLLELHGIGPKTYDYLSCLVGLDCIAVDRHVRTFATEAGVSIRSYDQLKSVVSFAADLLEITRRDFDAWIWQTISARSLPEEQMPLGF